MKLPTAIAGYFAAERDHDAAALSQHFIDNGIVKDDGEVHTGREAIATWMSEAWAKYSATTEPVAISEAGPTRIVTTRVEGNFRGSPLELRYHFVLDGDLIAQLEVTS